MLPGRPLALGVDFDPALPDRAHQCLVVVLVLSGIADSEVGYSLLELIALAQGFFLSVSRRTHEIDAGNLALRVEAQQKAGRVATRKEKLYHVECLLSDSAGLQNLGTERRRPVVVLLKEARHCLHRVIGQLGIVLGGQLRTVDLTGLHLGEPLEPKGFDAFLCPHAGERRRAGQRSREATCQKRSHQRNHYLPTIVAEGLEGSGPSLPLRTVSQYRFAAPTERTPSSGPSSNGLPFEEPHLHCCSLVLQSNILNVFCHTLVHNSLS